MVKKNILFFVFNRYVNYGFLFIRGLVLAKFLGPVSFGIWGFLTLVLQYFTYSTLGINYAVTVKLSTDNKSEDVKNGNIPSTAIILSSIISLVILMIGLIIHFLGIPIFPKFIFDQYLILIVLIIALSNIQQVFINIYRVQKGILKIAIVESISAILLLASALIFRDYDLIKYQLWFMLTTNILSIIILVFHLPFSFRIRWDRKVIYALFRLGIPLLIYNFSFYMITISARTIVNIFFSDEILGYYTLANSIAFAVLLGFQSVAWAIYPDVLSKLSPETDHKEQIAIVQKINLIYNSGCYAVIFIAIAALPLLFLYLPDYRPALPVITTLLLAQVVLSASFGNNALAVAHHKQNAVAKISIGIVVFIIFVSVVISILGVDFLWIAIAVLLGSLAYTVIQTMFSTKLIGNGKPLQQVLGILSPGFLLAMGIVMAGSFFQNTAYLFFFAFVMFIVFDFKRISSAYRLIIGEIKKNE